MPAPFSGAMNFAGLPAEVVQESDRQIDAERQVQRLHLVDLGLAGLGLTGRSLDDAKPAGAGYRGGKLRARDPAHRSLDNGISGAGMGENAVHGFPLLREAGLVKGRTLERQDF
jgi:hypothetical protein